MEVKAVRSETPASDVAQNQSLARPSVTSEATTINQADSIDVAVNSSSVNTSEAHANLNDGISTINVIKDAADNLVQLGKSLNGVLEQGLSANLSDSRRRTLENEAKSLASEMHKVLNVQTPSGLQPLTGEAARNEVEARIGKSLDLIFPETKTDIPDPSKIQFSPREAIINTQASVEVTLRRFMALQQSITEAHDKARQALNKADVTAENVKASQTSVRDLDSALELAQTTQSDISSNSKLAIGSFSKLRLGAEELLR